MAVINNSISKASAFTAKQPTVQLDGKKFDQLIEAQGVRVRVYKTMLCPNVKKIDTGEHEVKCKLCSGTGFIDRSPQETWAFMQNQTLIKNFAKEGVFDDHQVACTFQSGVELQYFAKVELKDFTTTYYEIIQRQQGELDRLKYPAHAVEHLIDKSGVEYSEASFQINTTGDIKWLAGAPRPAVGQLYTIYYTYPITFRAINALHVNRFTQNSQKQDFKTPIQLPEQWILKRDYLLTREDTDGNPLKPNKNFVSTTEE